MSEGKVIDFINEHFSKEEGKEIIDAITELSFEKIFNNSIGILVDESIPKDEIVVASLTTGLLTSVNYKVRQLPETEHKNAILSLFAKLTERWLIMLVSENIDHSDAIFKSLEKSLRVACIQFGYEYKVLRQFFDFENIKLIVSSLKIQTMEVPQKAKRLRKQKYVWLEKGNLAELVDILLKQNFVKGKKEFFDLFLKSKDDHKVRWNEEKKFHLAHLLNRLFTENFARIEGNKGYFTYAEKHFVTFENEYLNP
ncbi:MAG TPA: hypothetical protein VL947_01060, partial [Cytophagales bacterium]|nr:hypothetical protein [Cytophagales bacterium]